jgi:hypothetical protein
MRVYFIGSRQLGDHFLESGEHTNTIRRIRRIRRIERIMVVFVSRGACHAGFSYSYGGLFLFPNQPILTKLEQHIPANIY